MTVNLTLKSVLVIRGAIGSWMRPMRNGDSMILAWVPKFSIVARCQRFQRRPIPCLLHDSLLDGRWSDIGDFGLSVPGVNPPGFIEIAFV